MDTETTKSKKRRLRVFTHAVRTYLPDDLKAEMNAAMQASHMKEASFVRQAIVFYLSKSYSGL